MAANRLALLFCLTQSDSIPFVRMVRSFRFNMTSNMIDFNMSYYDLATNLASNFTYIKIHTELNICYLFFPDFLYFFIIAYLWWALQSVCMCVWLIFLFHVISVCVYVCVMCVYVWYVCCVSIYMYEFVCGVWHCGVVCVHMWCVYMCVVCVCVYNSFFFIYAPLDTWADFLTWPIMRSRCLCCKLY